MKTEKKSLAIVFSTKLEGGRGFGDGEKKRGHAGFRIRRSPKEGQLRGSGGEEEEITKGKETEKKKETRGAYSLASREGRDMNSSSRFVWGKPIEEKKRGGGRVARGEISLISRRGKRELIALSNVSKTKQKQRKGERGGLSSTRYRQKEMAPDRLSRIWKKC